MTLLNSYSKLQPAKQISTICDFLDTRKYSTRPQERNKLTFPTYSHLSHQKKFLMASKLLSLNSLKERKKPRNVTDELAIVKAAAWAWFEHGSGSEGNAANEFDTRRTVPAPRPSRYKLEAMRMAKEAEEGSPIYSEKSLQVETVSRKLDGLVESSNCEVANCNEKTKKRMMMGKGFWLRHAVVCGTRQDVVDARCLKDSHLSAPIVNMAKCMPRSNGAL
ncbi:hypothetical protein L6164_030831 [Bauhinia variegata]|uniref:Uncharacterized protein n=1 Tax=Bauhinia variegata TaxID=167791 RepID=A0ACB9LDY4_BAUVA|nr:hypothetical protein L6164_030831 [Bauhinia variegata]